MTPEQETTLSTYSPGLEARIKDGDIYLRTRRGAKYIMRITPDGQAHSMGSSAWPSKAPTLATLPI